MTNTETKLPFMVSALVAVGAWLSCLIGILLMGWPSFLGAGGLLVLLAAVWTYAAGRTRGVAGAFWTQAALAFSICGKGMVIFGLVMLWHLSAGQAFWLVLGITLAGYPVFTQKIDRAVMSFASAMALLIWVFQARTVTWPWLESFSVLLFVGAYLLFFVPGEKLRPVAWGLLPACLAAFGLAWMGGNVATLPFNTLFLALCLCGVYAWRAGKDFNVWLAVLMVVLAYLTNVGTVMGAALLALAFSRNRLSLKIAGIGVFALSLVWLYYHMHATLLAKSFYLWAAGLILLSVYAWQKRRGAYAR